MKNKSEQLSKNLDVSWLRAFMTTDLESDICVAWEIRWSAVILSLLELNWADCSPRGVSLWFPVPFKSRKIKSIIKCIRLRKVQTNSYWKTDKVCDNSKFL